MKDYLELLAVALGLIAVAGNGWTAYLANRFSTISGNLTALWRWKDNFDREYREARLEDARLYATRADELREYERLEAQMRGLESRLDERLAKMDLKLDRVLAQGRGGAPEGRV